MTLVEISSDGPGLCYNWNVLKAGLFNVQLKESFAKAMSLELRIDILPSNPQKSVKIGACWDFFDKSSGRKDRTTMVRLVPDGKRKDRCRAIRRESTRRALAVILAPRLDCRPPSFARLTTFASLRTSSTDADHESSRKTVCAATCVK